MEKRKITIGDYDTAVHGWTLTGLKLEAAKKKTNRLDKVNGDGSWDLSTVLTDGRPVYQDRALTVTLECSEGTRAEREAAICDMINLLDGLTWEIKLPDDALHHLVGDVHVVREYNDLVHAAVSVTAVCEPWKYADAETVVALVASKAKQTVKLHNRGRRATIPTLTVQCSSVLLEYGTSSLALASGTYRWADLMLTPGVHTLTYSGSGSVVITYREAVLE